MVTRQLTSLVGWSIPSRTARIPSILPRAAASDWQSPDTAVSQRQMRSTRAAVMQDAPDAARRAPEMHAGLHFVLEERLLDLLDHTRQLKARQPAVVGLGRFRRRLQKELDFLRSLSCGPAGGSEGCSPAAKVVAAPPDATGSEAALPDMGSNDGDGLLAGIHSPLTPQLQGVVNNVRGLGAELDVARTAPGVIGISRRFTQDGPLDADSPAEGGAGASCEVDVIAQDGHAWVEVKSHSRFGIHSQHWVGSSAHQKGMRQQAEEQLAVAAAPCNVLRWTPPAVVFHFSRGASPDVADELRRIGITVTGPGPITEGQLPPLPPPPASANLDVTTLCALVSEAVNGDPMRPEMQAWRRRTSHWQECLDAEMQSPLHAELVPLLAGRRVFAAGTAVRTFESLVSQFAGELERARWRRLQPLITVVDVADFPAKPAASPAAAPASGGPAADGVRQGAEQPGRTADGNQPWQQRQWQGGAAAVDPAGEPAQPSRESAPLMWQADWAERALTAGSADGAASAATATSATARHGGTARHDGTAAGEPAGSSAAAGRPSGGALVEAAGEAGAAPPPPLPPPRSVRMCDGRLASVPHLTNAVRAVLAVGDAVQAETLTANGRAVAAAASAGVIVEAHVHRAAWLTGL